MEHVGVNQDLEELIAVLKHVQMIVETLDGVIMELVFATQNMLELIVKFIKRMFIFQLNAH